MIPSKPSRLHLTSPAARDGRIPSEYTCDGDNRVLPLRWTDVPEQTRSFALLVEDPDAPKKDFVHWILWNIPADLREIEGAPPGSVQGRNDFDELGWGGPCPPKQHEQHRYVFHLYALDAELELARGAQRDDLLKAIEPHVLGIGEFTATYRRQAASAG